MLDASCNRQRATTSHASPGRTDGHDGVHGLAGTGVVLAHGQQAPARLVHRGVREAVPRHVRQLRRRARRRAEQRLPVQLLVLRARVPDRRLRSALMRRRPWAVTADM